MRIELLFDAPFSKKVPVEVFPIPSRAEAATVGEVITALCLFYTPEPWFPPGLKPADIELHTESGAHFNRRSPATVFQTKPLEPDLRICVVVRKTFTRSERTLKRCQACGKDKSRMEFARRKRKGGAHDCKGCTEKTRQAQAVERAISVQPEVDHAQQDLPRPASFSEEHTGGAQRLSETAPLEPPTSNVVPVPGRAGLLQGEIGRSHGEDKPPTEVVVPVEDHSQCRSPQVDQSSAPRVIPKLDKRLPHLRVKEVTFLVRLSSAKKSGHHSKLSDDTCYVNVTPVPGCFLMPGDVVCDYARNSREGYICITPSFAESLWLPYDSVDEIFPHKKKKKR